MENGVETSQKANQLCSQANSSESLRSLQYRHYSQVAQIGLSPAKFFEMHLQRHL